MGPETLSIIVSFALLLALLAAGVHIGPTLALAGIVGIWVFLGTWTPGISMLFIQSMDVSSSYMLMVIPLFIVLGSIATASGVTGDLFTLFYRWFGRVRGGIAISTIGTCAGMASITGSSVATSAAMSRIALPQLRNYRYDEALSVGAIAVGGTLSIMIPPSITLVLYAIFAQQSVGKMLIAGIIPGLILTSCYALLIYVRCRVNPELGPPGPRFTLRERLEVVPAVLPFFLIIGAVIGGILSGIWTPVESASVATVMIILLAFVRRRLTVKRLLRACREAVVMSASVFVIVIGSMVFSGFLAINGFSDALAEAIVRMELSPFSLFLFLLLVYLVLGMFMEVSSLLALTIPLLMPIVIAVGWDPIWFGVIVVAMMEVAAVTPPVGLNLYAVKAAVPEVRLQTIYRGAIPFWLVNLAVIMLLYLLPQIVLFLPDMH